MSSLKANGEIIVLHLELKDLIVILLHIVKSI